MFIVIPRLTSEPTVYGIYTICVSLNLFFSYADLGFLGAGQKYAAEYFAQNNLEKEMKVIGFVLFFLATMMAIFIILLFGLSYKPELILKSDSTTDLHVGSKLIFILALFSPTVMLQRFNSLIYSIRIEDYIYQSVEVIFNLLKILSIQLFISKGSYDIINYYLTIQILSLISALIGSVIAVYRYNYHLKTFFTYLSYNKEMYTKTKSLAFSSLLLTVAWILYFELDALILSKFYGLKVVAMYAIGFSFLSFARNLYNTIFSPFLSRFNHFAGTKDDAGLFANFDFLIRLTFPICIIPPLVIVFYMNNIILTWVGIEYLPSVLISQLFIFTAAIGALGIPINYLILAKAQNKALRINAVILPVIFFGAMFILNIFIAEKSLAVAKMLTIVCSFSLIFYFCFKTIGQKVGKLYYGVAKNMIIPIVIMGMFFLIIPNVYIRKTGGFNAYFNLGLKLFLAVLVPLLVYYYSDGQVRKWLFAKIRRK